MFLSLFKRVKTERCISYITLSLFTPALGASDSDAEHNSCTSK